MITIEGFGTLKKEITGRLQKELSPKLSYHNVAHTIDVLEKAEQIAVAEGVSVGGDMLLLKIAALFHDTGFLLNYQGHEAQSCNIMEEWMQQALDIHELEIVQGLIMATKIPQTPVTHLQQIICDADLDYLGRDDFEPISNGLKHEFLSYHVVKDGHEWEEMQIRFFEGHHYFTKTSNTLRNAAKQQRLVALKKAFSLQYGV